MNDSSEHEAVEGEVTLPPEDAAKWLKLIKDSKSHFDYYLTKCTALDKKYADLKGLGEGSVEREFQIFWANLEVLKPSIYSRPPKPVVTPRYKDRKELPRKASELLQRVLETEYDLADINETMLLLRDDLAMAARGVPWLRYKEADNDGMERVCFDHVDRDDFLCDPARSWKEVDWVARGSWLTRKEGISRFGSAWSDVALLQNKVAGNEEYKGEAKGRVWEIWHRSENVVVWVAENTETTLDRKEPFLKLDGFFPCPKPAHGTLQRRSLIPVPDYVYYKDQVDEINELTARISALSEGLRLKGFYAGGNEELATAIERAIKSQQNHAVLIPVSSFAALGGAALKDSIVWLPIADVVTTVQSCLELRRQFIEDVYQITGLSDIMRGATDPNETLGAQQLKSQYGNVRIRDRQSELVRVARDMTRIAAEIMAENYSVETFVAKSQMDIPTDAQIAAQRDQLVAQVEQAAGNPEIVAMAQQNPEQAAQMKQQIEEQLSKLEQTVTIEKIVDLFRQQKMRPFVLDIETDSTIQPDENAEKEARAEFITAVGGFLNQSAPMVMQAPETGPFVGEMLKFVAAPFRAGREVESVIEDFAEQIKGRAQQQPKGPSPDEVKAKADAEARQQELTMKQEQHRADMEIKAAEMEAKKQEYGLKADTEKMKFAIALAQRQADKERYDVEMSDRAADRDHKNRQSEMALSGERAKAGIPDGYSFDDDRAQFAAIMDEMRASREAQTAMMQMMMHQTEAIAQGMAALAKAQSTPRSVRKQPDGSYSMQFETVN